MWEKDFLPSCLPRRARTPKGSSSFTEWSTGICALVESSYITVNLIKYIVIPTEGILISWVRNKSFSLLLQMKTSTLFCREGMSLADWLAPRSPHQPLQASPAANSFLLGRFQGWDSGDGRMPLGREKTSSQRGQGCDPLKAWEMTRWCGEGHRR